MHDLTIPDSKGVVMPICGDLRFYHADGAYHISGNGFIRIKTFDNNLNEYTYAVYVVYQTDTGTEMCVIDTSITETGRFIVDDGKVVKIFSRIYNRVVKEVMKYRYAILSNIAAITDDADVADKKFDNIVALSKDMIRMTMVKRRGRKSKLEERLEKVMYDYLTDKKAAEQWDGKEKDEEEEEEGIEAVTVITKQKGNDATTTTTTTATVDTIRKDKEDEGMMIGVEEEEDEEEEDEEVEEIGGGEVKEEKSDVITEVTVSFPPSPPSPTPSPSSPTSAPSSSPTTEQERTDNQDSFDRFINELAKLLAAYQAKKSQ